MNDLVRFDLGVGEPVFLQRTLLATLEGRGVTVDLPARWGYPDSAGLPELIDQLKAFMPQYQYFVPTIGARQGLVVAIKALWDVDQNLTKGLVGHPNLCWPGFKDVMLQCGGAAHIHSPPIDARHILHCVTSPNNPDGTVYGPEHPQWGMCDVWDASYSYGVIYGNITPPRHRVAVFSASKSFGCSHARIGWCATNDRRLAEAIANACGKETHGVSALDQLYLARLLRHVNDGDEEVREALKAARDTIVTNATTFLEVMRDHVHDVSGAVSGVGMFVWFRPRNALSFQAALDRSSVKMTPGLECGDYNPGRWRCSMGNGPLLTREALTRLREELEST